jgi:hypothetical protein
VPLFSSSKIEFTQRVTFLVNCEGILKKQQSCLKQSDKITSGSGRLVDWCVASNGNYFEGDNM